MSFVSVASFSEARTVSVIKIIVKQIDGGEKHFWSIIPFWGMNQNTKERILHDGTPEED
ncbi:MAG: hypothetical protein NT098_02835 [Candidatus Parcubacteria bacterium]|nr:hypothetical protein [Candidatus Parcubacteria bacterium]